MKIAILFLCAFCVLSYKKADAQDIGILQNSCLRQQGIAINELPQLLADESEEGRRKRGCLVVCYFEKIGLMKDNQLNIDVINDLFTRVMPPGERTESAQKAINECAATATSAGGDDPCIVADKFTQCGLEEFKVNIRSLFYQNA